MTSYEVKVLPDGTRKYASYHTYTPVPLEERKYRVRKPDDPRAVRFGDNWYLPLEMLPDEDRVMPLTRPDDQTLEHRASCRCEVCRRPQAAELWRKYRARVLGISR